MLTKISILVFTICMCCIIARSQTGYSESIPYKPMPPGKANKKNKPERKTEAPAISAPVDTNGIEIVRIPISVFDKTGAVVRSLTKSDVSILVDNVETPVSAFETDGEPLNIILVLDTSPSTDRRLEGIRQRARKLVEALPSDAKVMVAEFNSEMNIRSQLTANRAETWQGINKAKIGDGTSIYSALRTLFQKVLPQVPGRKAIVLMTDGVDTTSRTTTYADSLIEVEKSDVSIYPVFYDTLVDRPKGMTLGIDPILAQILLQRAGLPAAITPEEEYKRGRQYLNDLASATGGRVISAEKFDAGIKSLVNEFQGRYYATVSVPGRGSASRLLKVRINRPGLVINARGSFIQK